MSRTLISVFLLGQKSVFLGLQQGRLMLEMRVGVLEGCEGVMRWWRDLWIGTGHEMYL